ncbi:phosphate acetyltransferase [Actibacterium mucosum KCTC 23349]|uniref:Phosphate acetyltransferase n=1 Tax=Actibacterium mucosum KCTC 23349 TaxID=1454373 RepID=A0A037ZIT6_9RHOB|nr:phosphate acetyltransferase [Actibacterium mucosum]KAJ55437.1 phosphate acetyltransferase [Actibacterium mucosum KCTC 23349]
MKLGDFAETTRVYSDTHRAEFETLTGQNAAAGTVPEPLIAAMFSYLLGVELPGGGTNYLKQSLSFVAQAPLDEPLTARVEITRLRPEKHLVDLATTCRTGSGTLVCEGRALVLAKDVGA